MGRWWLERSLVDSNVYAGSTADLMSAGKQFHCAIRGLILLYKALSQLLLSAFFDWCQKTESVNGIPPQILEIISKGTDLI